jgi:hypothetical protein
MIMNPFECAAYSANFDSNPPPPPMPPPMPPDPHDVLDFHAAMAEDSEHARSSERKEPA